jgi:HTH-type transcriptional regulator / antitoxin HigA
MSAAFKPKVIKTIKQYDEYCERLAKLDTADKKLSQQEKEEMELLEVLIDNWEAKSFKRKKMDPIQLLGHLMEVHGMDRNDLIDLLDIGRSAVSQIMTYQKGLSKEVIRKLADHFKLSQDAFNRPYPLRVKENRGRKTEKMMNTRKTIAT